MKLSDMVDLVSNPDPEPESFISLEQLREVKRYHNNKEEDEEIEVSSSPFFDPLYVLIRKEEEQGGVIAFCRDDTSDTTVIALLPVKVSKSTLSLKRNR